MMVSALLQTGLDKLRFMNFKIILLFYLTESGDEKKKQYFFQLFRDKFFQEKSLPLYYAK